MLLLAAPEIEAEPKKIEESVVVWIDDGKIVNLAELRESGLTKEDAEALQEQVDDLYLDPYYNIFTNIPIRCVNGGSPLADRIHYLPDASPEEIDQVREAFELSTLARINKELDRRQQLAHDPHHA
jgi:hypothetical protein